MLLRLLLTVSDDSSRVVLFQQCCVNNSDHSWQVSKPTSPPVCDGASHHRSLTGACPLRSPCVITMREIVRACMLPVNGPIHYRVSYSLREDEEKRGPAEGPILYRPSYSSTPDGVYIIAYIA